MVHGPAQYHFRAHATIPRLESSLRSLMTVPGTFSWCWCLFMGTFTEGSVKISPIFRRCFMRFVWIAGLNDTAMLE